jgi:hypothetical protein
MEVNDGHQVDDSQAVVRSLSPEATLSTPSLASFLVIGPWQLPWLDFRASLPSVRDEERFPERTRDVSASHADSARDAA